MLTFLTLESIDPGGGGVSEENPPTQALQLGFELALKERDAVLRDNARTLEERDEARRQLEATRAELTQARAELDQRHGRDNQKSSDTSTNNEGSMTRTGSKRKDKSAAMETEQAYEELRYSTTSNNNNSSSSRSGPNVVWETHQVTLNKAPTFGFGIAVSGGRDSPHFASGDPSVAISDVLKAGPAEGKLQINDRIVTVNGITLENVDHATAINVLRDCGNTVNLVVRRRIVMPAASTERQGSIPFKIVLNKKNKKDDFGVVLGYKLFIAEIASHSLASHEPTLKEGDTVLKINNTPVESLSLPDARKLIEKTKDKLQLIVSKGRRDDDAPRETPAVNQATVNTDLNPVTSQPMRDVNIYRPSVRSEEEVYPKDPTRQAVPPGAYPKSENTRFDGHYVLDNDLPSRSALMAKPSDTDHRNGYYSDRENGRLGPPEMQPQHDWGDYAEDEVFPNRSIHDMEPRTVTFPKDKQTGLGLRLAGGNATGIFIASVQQGSAAEREGLVEGDLIMSANDKEISGLTREDAVSYLTSLMGDVTMVVQYRKEDYDRIMASHEAGDAFYIRTHFNYTATDVGTEHSIKVGDIFLVKDTLFRGMCWLAVKTSEDVNENKKGTIPSSKTAEVIKSTQKQDGDKENLPVRGRGSLFKRKSSRRAKSLGKDHWDEVVFAGLSTKFPAYERVVLRDADFMRPVVIFGAVSDIARERLLAEYPDRFESPQVEKSTSSDGQKKEKSAIIRLGSIREAISHRKHCLLDVTPQNVDRLNYAQFNPIVIHLKADSKQAVKDVRSRWKNLGRNPRKLLEQSERIEKMYSHLFTGVLSHMGTDAWFPKLCKMIETQQRQQIWMSEQKPAEDISDDYMFPMSSRMSLAVGTDSDIDLPRPRDDFDVSPQQKKRLVRSSSDPSINTLQHIPGIPPYPVPPTYKNQRIPSHDSRFSAEPSPRLPPQHDYQMHPEDRYYPSYYSDQAMLPNNYSNRANIDPYATLTPSERLRPRMHSDQYGGNYEGINMYRNQMGEGEPRQMTSQQGGGNQQPSQAGPYNDGSSQSSDSYSKYVSSPQNKHDDTKLREKFGSLQLSARDKAPGHDPYRFTRSTANPINATVDKAKLNDISQRFRRQEAPIKAGPIKSQMHASSQPELTNSLSPKKKEPPPVPVKTYSLKQRGIEPDEIKIRNYENSNRAYNYADVKNSSGRFSAGSLPSGSTPPLPPPPSSAALYMSPSDSDRPYEYMSFNQTQDNLIAGSNNSPASTNNSNVNNRLEQSPQNSHYYSPHNGYNNSNIKNNLTPSFIQQQHQNRVPHKNNHHYHSLQRQHQNHNDHYTTMTRGNNFNESSPHQAVPTRAGGSQDALYDSKAYANEVYMDHQELSRSRSSGVLVGSSEQGRIPMYEPTYKPGQHIDRGPDKEDYSHSPSQSRGYVRPRTDDEQLQELQRSRNRARSETRLADNPEENRRWANSAERRNAPSSRTSFAGSASSSVSTRQEGQSPATSRRNPHRDERETNNNQKSNSKNESKSAFQMYRKPDRGEELSNEVGIGGRRAQSVGSMLRYNKGEENQTEENHTVIATAKGYFTSRGGILEAPDTGVSIFIPEGAIDQGKDQEIYFKVCRDNNLLPPLDTSKGETLLSPLVMCGPHGTTFNKPVELRLPHCASANPESWSFALKSSDSPSGETTEWHNTSLAGHEGVTRGTVDKNSVSIMVDHF